jgi:hypothetical protein
MVRHTFDAAITRTTYATAGRVTQLQLIHERMVTMGEKTIKAFPTVTPRRPIMETTRAFWNTGVRGPPLQHPELYLKTTKQTCRRNSNENE